MGGGSVCCLLVLDSVTSTPQWIRQPGPRGCVHDVYVFVCKRVLERSRVSQPLNLRLCLLQHSDFLTSPRAVNTRSSCHFSPSRSLCRSPPAPHTGPPFFEQNSVRRSIKKIKAPQMM
jgi:hypothetical protein